MPFSRQEKLRAIFETCVDGSPLLGNKKLYLKLFPPELKRFKEEFPELTFSVTNTIKSINSKKYEVTISKK